MMNAQVSPTDRCQQAGPGEADRGRAEGGDRQEGVGGGQFLVAGHLRDEAVVGRIEELLDPGVEQQQRVQPDDGVELDDERDQADDDRLDQTGDDQDPLAVVPVDVDPGQQAHDQARDGRRHQGQADGQGRPGLAIDPDAGGQVGQRRARRRDRAGRATAARSRGDGRRRTWTARGPSRRTSVVRPLVSAGAPRVAVRESTVRAGATVTPSRSRSDRLWSSASSRPSGPSPP